MESDNRDRTQLSPKLTIGEVNSSATIYQSTLHVDKSTNPSKLQNKDNIFSLANRSSMNENSNADSSQLINKTLIAEQVPDR